MQKKQVKADLSQVVVANESALNPRQISCIKRKTNGKYVKTRPGKGGQKWSYVATSHVIEVLNKVFGYAWSFKVLTSEGDALEMAIRTKCVVVRGSLTAMTEMGPITKEQYGRKEVMTTKSGGILDFGNDMKAAASDALKKCASEFGLFQDVYAPEDYMEFEVVDGEVAGNRASKASSADASSKTEQVAEAVRQSQRNGRTIDSNSQYGRMGDVVNASKKRMEEILESYDKNNR